MSKSGINSLARARKTITDQPSLNHSRGRRCNMRKERALILTCLALTLSGCGPKKIVPANFAFVTPATTFQELTARLPAPDRAYLRDGTIFWEWDLSNSTNFMRIKDQSPPFTWTNRIRIVGVLPRISFIDFSKKRSPYHETNTP